MDISNKIKNLNIINETAQEKITDLKKSGLLEKWLEADTSKAEINRQVAEENGISVDILIASPNYEKLVSDWHRGQMEQKISEMTKVSGMNHEEATAFYLGMAGALG